MSISMLIPKVTAICGLITATRALIELKRIISDDKQQTQKYVEQLRKKVRKAYRDGEISGRERIYYERKLSLAAGNKDLESLRRINRRFAQARI
ncbi:hypothetical protein B0T14DRAFT_502006 [Immersiella caudata]|uniref:Uncharacterized protein n=1 Tax=Immersiella caudata TaxID=314043 RepID=A0AA39XCW4_9PEZI|nr:hypothetical protein B0T14DRAFT_502006 [Immersiella caudata]